MPSVRGPYRAARPTPTARCRSEHFGYAAIAFLLLAPLVIGSPRALVARVSAWRVARWLGAASYGIYLWHLIVLFFLLAHGVPTWWPGNAMLVVALLTVVPSLLLGTASYVLV